MKVVDLRYDSTVFAFFTGINNTLDLATTTNVSSFNLFYCITGNFLLTIVVV